MKLTPLTLGSARRADDSARRIVVASRYVVACRLLNLCLRCPGFVEAEGRFSMQIYLVTAQDASREVLAVFTQACQAASLAHQRNATVVVQELAVPAVATR